MDLPNQNRSQIGPLGHTEPEQVQTGNENFRPQPSMQNNIQNSGDRGTHKISMNNPLKSVNFDFLKDAFANKTLILLILVLQVVIFVLIILIFDPQSFRNEYENKQIRSNVEKSTDVDSSIEPTIATVSNIEELKDQHEINAEVYKDAQNGDYVLAYGEDIVIYRKKTKEIIYEGKNPNVILAERNQEIQNKLIAKATQAGIITEETSKNPQLTLINDADVLREEDSQFYEKAVKDDVIAYFPNASKILIYRPGEDQIIKSGSYNTQISK